MSGSELRSRSGSGMSRDAGEEARVRDRDSSRDSRDSSNREVRCGCQYYQTDSLLPERRSLVGTRPASRQSQHESPKLDTTMIGDHEYEPINPMASQPPSPPVVEVTEPEVAPKKKAISRITYIDNDPNFIHIPLHGSDEDVQEAYLQIPTDDKIIVSQDVDADADAEEEQDDQEEKELDDEDLSAQDFQNRMEERFFAPTPTTTESRTDCEMNTSQIDSSALEDLPLKRESRKLSSDLKGFQHRIRSQAGRLRTKIRNIPKPKLSLPDRPKFHLPERPKFNLPDRSKLNLPDRPKFSLPDRPKFSLPDRPKFNMPQRPKISMPNFNIGGKARTSSSLRRPLRDRNQSQSSTQSTVGGKKNIFDSLNFRTYPRFFNKKKRIAEENARIKGKRAMTPPPRMETDSIPSSPASRKGPFGQTWVQRYRDIKYADDENRSNQSDKRSASLKAMSSFEDSDVVEDDSAAFRDPDFGAATSLDVTKKKLQAISAGSLPDSDKEQRSSGSSSERHRVGVLEEIDADEFFLRQKGLSREDVDVSRYLSLEIRDAFRSPKNALARMDTDPYQDEDEEVCEEVNERVQQISAGIEENTRKPKDYEDEAEFEPQPHVEPKRPSRTRSLKSKRSTQSKSSLELKEDKANYNTYPPVRPSRSRKQSMQSMQSKHSIMAEDKDEVDINEGYDFDEARFERRAPSIPSFDKQPSIHSTNDIWPQESQPPLPPKRRKSTKDLSRDNESMIDELCPDDDWLDEVNAQVMMPGEITALQIEPRAPVIITEHHQYDSPPVAPNRKTRSRATSLADEDRTSRGCESLVSEAQSMPVEDFPAVDAGDANDNFGYATVEKPEHRASTLERPQRQKRNKPARPPPPNRRKKATTQMMNLKNQGIHFFFTYPRRAIKSLHKDQHPVRPVRNYSTLGPSRPPRRSKVFKEPVYAEGENIPFMDESEKETLDSSTPKVHQTDELDKPEKELIIENKETVDDIRDLQSGDIIEKMKGRPLPAPPRPPRKSKNEDQLQESMDPDYNETLDDDEVVVSEKINIQILHPSETSKSKSDTQIQEIESSPPKEVVESVTQVQISQTEVSPTKEVTSGAKLSPAKEVDSKPDKQKSEPKLSPGREGTNVKAEPEKEKKDGPFATLKEMISQKKREFFEPKKETSPTSNKQEIVEKKTTVETKSSREPSPMVRIIPLKSDEDTETSPEEANVSTQTDPLPEGYLVEEVQPVSEETQALRARTPVKTESHRSSEPKTESSVHQATPESQVQIQTVIEKRIVVMPDQDTEVSFLKAQKLQVSELEVEKMNVSELQAKKISVSDIDGVAMQVSEISSKAGHLVINGIELPPNFLQSLLPVTTHEQIQASTQTITQSQAPATVAVSESGEGTPMKKPPLDPAHQPPVVVYPSQTPIVVYPPQTNISGQQTIAVHPAHIPHYYNPEYVPPQIPRTRSPPRDSTYPADSEEEAGSLMPVVRRRHHHSHKHSERLSTDEEEDTARKSPRSGDRHLQEQPTATATQLTGQLLRIGWNSLTAGVVQVVEGMNRLFPNDEKRKDAQTAACIVLVLIAGLILLGFGQQDKTVHHHHWDFLPPH